MPDALRLLLAALLLGLTTSATNVVQARSTPAAQSGQDPIRIASLNDGRFRFAQDKTSRVVDLTSSISGCTGSLYDSSTGQKLGGSVAARVLDEVQQSGVWYVVLQVDTNTGCNVQGMCGAGSSTDVIWLKLGSGLKAEARQAQAVDDCATDTELTEFDGKAGSPDSNAPAQLETRKGVLALTSKRDDYTKNTTTTITLRYDHNAAQKGLVVTNSTQPMN